MALTDANLRNGVLARTMKALAEPLSIVEVEGKLWAWQNVQECGIQCGPHVILSNPIDDCAL